MDTLIWAMVVMVPTDEASTSVRLMPRLPTTEAMVLDPMALATVLAMVMPSPPMATLATPLATVPMAVDISFKISTHCYQSQVIKKLKN